MNILKLLVGLAVVPVSYLTMIHGWGIEPVNLEWVAFGYLFVTVAAFLAD